MKWNSINIGEVVEQTDNWVATKTTHKYKLLGLRLEGRGLFLREEKLGREISSTYLNKVIHGDFIYSRLFAWKGSFDIVPKNLEGAFVSSEFPTFKINKKVADAEFLKYYFQLSTVWKEVEQLSSGSTKQSRNRFKEEQFLSLSISLPALPVQQSIVKKLVAIKSKIELIQKLRTEQQKDFQRLIYSDYLEVIEECEWLPLSEVSPIVRRPFEPEKDVDYIEIGIRSFGNGTFQKPPVKGKLIAHKSLFKMSAGDLLFSNVFAWEGAIALATEMDDVCIGSHRFITSVPNKEVVHPEFLLYHFHSPIGHEAINKASPGSAGRNKTLGITKLEKILVPVPNMDKQIAFAKLLYKVTEIRKVRVNSEPELKALFPSVLDKAFKGEW